MNTNELLSTIRDALETIDPNWLQEIKGKALAALDQLEVQQQPKRLTDEEIDRLRNDHMWSWADHDQHTALDGFVGGLRYARDNGYLGGLTVDEVMEVTIGWRRHFFAGEPNDYLWGDLRARLTAKAQGQ